MACSWMGETDVRDTAGVRVRPLAEEDLDEADRIFRVAFGTFLGMPEPEKFSGDADSIRTRWKAFPGGALAAELDGRLVGSNFAANWGSVGFFGLLTVAQSAKHVGLYQKYGFWPRFLTAIMSRLVDPDSRSSSTRISAVADKDLANALEAVGELTGAVYPGLDLSREIRAVRAQRLGDTVLIDDGADLQGAAICHVGAGTEAGGGACYVKFGAVRPGPGGERRFGLLIDACHGLAADRGASVLVAGANAGRDRAWRALTDRGFRRDFQGVTMHRPNEPGYSTSDSYVIDDWR